MSARDDLAADLWKHRCEGYVMDSLGTERSYCQCGAKVYPMQSLSQHQAEVILAAGYTKPRTITTVEELDALSTGSVIVTVGQGQRVGKIKKASDGKLIVWAIIGDNIAAMNSLVMTDALPVTVLHEPVAS